MPSPAFASQCKAVAVEIARLAGVTIDTAIYDRVRLFRCPNTRHGKTGLYKIPVSFWEITAVRDVAGILEWAKAPRRQVSPPAENMASVAFRADVPVMPSAVALWCAVCGPLPSSALPTGYAENAGLSPANPPAGVAGLPLPTPANPPAGRVKCQSQTLPESGAAVPRLRRETFDFIRHGAEHGRRAVTLFNAAADCTRCGWPAGAVFSVLMDVARDAGLSGFEAESQIQAGVKAGGNGGEI